MSDMPIEPWEECGLTKSQYFGELRSVLRSATTKSKLSKPTTVALNKAKIKKRGKDARGIERELVFYVCAECTEHFPRRQDKIRIDIDKETGEETEYVIGTEPAVYVDHIEGAGSLTCFEDVPSFINHLLADSSRLQVLCKSCHDLKTFMERYGYSKQEAIARKRAIEWAKNNTPKQQKEFLLSKGCKEDIGSEVKRKSLYTKYQLHLLKKRQSKDV